ncbi:MAG: polyamine aminopropyltransferase [Candidatus Omnitrophota bacterium]
MNENHRLPSGTNLRILLQDCRCGENILKQPELFSPLLIEAIQTSGLTFLKETSYCFAEGGFTAAYILAESHVVIHTWPEHGRLALAEISVCDFQRINEARTLALGERIAEIFLAQRKLTEQAAMIPRLIDAEKVRPAYGMYLDIESLLFTRQSPYQKITIGETKAFGRFLALDGVLQTSEGDDFYFNEPLVHIPLLCHPQPKRVLICGGGDGGAAREVLKHPCVERCDIVEIDPVMIEAAREWLHPIHRGSLDDSRVTLHIEDAAKFIYETQEPYDAILVDTADPARPEPDGFPQEFYEAAARQLAPGGYLALHVGAPLLIGENSARIAGRLRKAFRRAEPYMQFVPSYGTIIGYLLCSQEESAPISLETADQRLTQRGIVDLRIVSPETIQAIFVIPPGMRRFFERSAR